MSGGERHSIEPSARKVELWYARLDAEETPEQVARCRRSLSAEELAAERRFAREELRQRWRRTRAMARDVLSRYHDVPPEAWEFERSSLGKPEVVGPVNPPLRFNLAHSGRLIVCAVSEWGQDRVQSSAEGTIGVDVELVRDRPSMRSLARRFFAHDEVTWLEAQPPDQQRDAFYRIWTLKEAYLKAIGTGLSRPLKSFSVECEGHPTPAIRFNQPLQDTPRRWRLAQWAERQSPAEVYQLAVAVAGESADEALPLEVSRHRWYVDDLPG